MIGTILTISDADGQTFVDNARDAWNHHGFTIDVMNVEDAVKCRDFSKYSMIALTMAAANQEMFKSCMSLIRGRAQAPIVLFPIAAVTPESEIGSLQAGADRVISLPMDMNQAIANCIALIRRYMANESKSTSQAPALLECDGLIMDLDYWIVMVQGHEVVLSPREYQLLRVFVEHRHQILSFRQIYRLIWNDDELGFSPALISNVASRLRAKLKVSKDTPNYIQNIRDVGYRFGVFK